MADVLIKLVGRMVFIKLEAKLSEKYSMASNLLRFCLISLSLFCRAYAQDYSPVIDPEKFTVCAITINSDEEKKVFSSQIQKKPKKFNPIVELTDFGGDKDWFKNACKSGIRCDQLVISGHFAGTFFGSSNKELSLKELEAAGCSKTCENILAKPYEVFLLGCNTLSGKNADTRTPQQYLQVLLDDGFDRRTAEQIVESRYGGLGDSHLSIMQRAFGGDKKNLYGFNSIGPSGKNIKSLLEKYFAKSPLDIRLEKLQGQRAMRQVAEMNTVLATSLKSTNFAQCASSDMKDKTSKLICQFRDENLSLDKKLDLTLEAFTRDDYLVYIPSINSFISGIDIDELSAGQLKAFNQLAKNEVIHQQIRGLISTTKSPVLVGEWILFAKNLRLMSDDEASESISKKVNELFAAPLSVEVSDSICSIERNIRRLIKVNPKAFKGRKLADADFKALKCLEISKEALKYLAENLSPKTGPQGLIDFLHVMNRTDDNVGQVSEEDLASIKSLLTYRKEDGTEEVVSDFFKKYSPMDKDFRKYLLDSIFLPRSFGGSMVYLLDAETITEDERIYLVQKFANSSSNYASDSAMYYAMSILIKTDTPSPELLKTMLTVFKNNKLGYAIRNQALLLYKKTKITDREVFVMLLEQFKSYSYNARINSLEAMKASEENMPTDLKDEMEKIIKDRQMRSE